MSGEVYRDDVLPVKDIDNAVEMEMSKLHHARLHTMGSGKQVLEEHSEKHSEIRHSEL